MDERHALERAIRLADLLDYRIHQRPLKASVAVRAANKQDPSRFGAMGLNILNIYELDERAFNRIILPSAEGLHRLVISKTQHDVNVKRMGVDLEKETGYCWDGPAKH